MNTSAMAVSVNADRLLARHDAMARHGATPLGGVNRPALSAEETRARKELVDWGRARGFACSVDPIGNIFVRRPGIEVEALPVRTGSHLDSQMPGGNYDGVYGVLAAFEVLETLEDNGIDTLVPVELVVWNNEEGCRFSPTTMGSAVHAGALPLGQALKASDPAGITVAEALAASLQELGDLPRAELGSPSKAYIEAHIEQGTLLESQGLSVGAVTGIQGTAQFLIEVLGQEAHAGTTPKEKRKDALRDAIRLMEALDAAVQTDDDLVRFTVGKLDVWPNAVNTVPSRVVFTVDLRHPSAELFDRLVASVKNVCASASVACQQTLQSSPVSFDPAVVAIVEESCAQAGLGTARLPSGATHDAKYMAELCSSGMIFIPCRDGISHNEREHAQPRHMVDGANILLASILRLAGEATGSSACK
ncbi:MAG: M20 family metallo-hydrolase [Mesorhizobium sp.]|uniref:M20 family metallo-hydrolase n=1 Tax=Mesorhizobium sp. TaxID=1871066 RepID=UPI0012257213|nr:M20 family metallo-hydrolase [Mesorhizobium sp.]TIP30735.1 MAG: M20 family metallo-hydrolase [Mesorhizobium sp.]